MSRQHDWGPILSQFWGENTTSGYKIVVRKLEEKSPLRIIIRTWKDKCNGYQGLFPWG
jgi:hypothetical protein